ncbi:MAG: EAL domain-containing protein [Clostridiales bacterium]|nr:EAL domain-containing protein [Clostridiales bacterium]
MGRDRADRSVFNSTMRDLTLKREAPKSAFILIILIYIISSVLTVIASGSEGHMIVFNSLIPHSAFAGVFSTVTYICVVILVVLFRKTGFITALFLLLAQFPMMIVNIFVKHITSNFPGLFTNIFTIIAVVIIYLSYGKVLKYQKSIRDQAIKDGLTMLPNRFACGELMDYLIDTQTRFAIVSADLDNFKSINDTMGHETGDKMLIKVADRWTNLSSERRTDTDVFVARISGDEYTLIIRGYENNEVLEKTITLFKEELERKITIDDCDFYMTACFGWAEFPINGKSSEDMFHYADAALHEVKKNGTGKILRFDADILNEKRTVEIERKLRDALNGGKIHFNLQPQYDMDHNLRGFEALARLIDSDGSYISPGQFIPVAEKTGLIDQIDMRVFELALDFLDKILLETDSDIVISSNISVRHLMKNSFIDELKKIIDSHNVSADHIEIEITESIMIDSAEKALNRIEEIKKLGIKVAIDDFGTGYSSLSYLNSFPSDLLKIDKSFIDGMDVNDSSKQFVAMIISIGHVLDLKVISEGVESAEQVQALKNIGCDYVQGYVWGRPMEPEDAKALIGE